jgi:prenyltransferase beta subunit
MINKILKIILKVLNRINEDGLLNTVKLVVHVFWRITDRNLFFRKRMQTYLRKSQLAIEAGLSVNEIRSSTLGYVESMRINSPGHYGRYRYCQSQQAPLLYASVFAVLTRSLYNDLDTLSDQNRAEWIKYIQSFQCDDGLFRDAEVDCELASNVLWWGWMHLTYHSLMALACLGVKSNIPILKDFQNPTSIRKWFLSLNITSYPSPKLDGHAPWIYVMLLQYARDIHDVKWANDAITYIIELLNEQLDPLTGCWGTRGHENNKLIINEGVQIGYHFWIFYFYDKLEIPYGDKVIDSLLLSQNELGGFGITLNSSACDDIDSIDPLCRLLTQQSYRKKDIEHSLKLSVPWVLANRNLDGGFVFKRDEPFQYGHIKMLSRRNESHMFATWFRSLSLAYIGKALPEHFLGSHHWNLPRVPGVQFWI